MITFFICLIALVASYFLYGAFIDKLVGIDPKADVPSNKLYDGVDYIPLPRWRIFLIQLLNIAGTGPIFGAVLGACYGPVAFLWITLGGIFLGAMHDYISGVISLRNDGKSLPEIIGKYLGGGMHKLTLIIIPLLMILVGAVFIVTPSQILADKSDMPYLFWVGVIIVYYFVATILPIDKIIGKIYPIFGAALIIMAVMLFGVLLIGDYTIPELVSLDNMHFNAKSLPIVPTLFISIACGAISGFHATQSPLMARCMRNENESREVFYGAMISESVIALIWAAIGMAFWSGVEGLNGAIAANGGAAAILVDNIATATLGEVLALFVIFGVVACAITSGDTAFRSARLIAADMFGIEQKSIVKRIGVCIPVFALGLAIILLLPFGTIWSYFAWANQTLAVFTLWTICVWLHSKGRNIWIALVPALVMTYVCASYIFVSPLMFGMENRLVAYLLGGVLTALIAAFMLKKVYSYGKKHS